MPATPNERLRKMKLHYFEESVLNQLRADVPENLERYRDDADCSWVGEKYPILESSAEIKGFEFNDADFLRRGNSVADDCENSIALFSRFESLSPRLAAQETLWCCLCHSVLEFYKYTRERWKTTDADVSAEKIRAHFFGRIDSDLRTENALARLWWGAFVSADNRFRDDRRFRLTRVLWKNTMRFTDFMDTFNSHSRSRARGVLLALERYDAEAGKFYTNSHDFRALNKALNRLSVVEPLDFWPEEEIYKYALGFFRKRREDHEIRRGNDAAGTDFSTET